MAKRSAQVLDGGFLANEASPTSKEDFGVEGKKGRKSSKQAIVEEAQGKKRAKAVKHVAAAISEERQVLEVAEANKRRKAARWVAASAV